MPTENERKYVLKDCEEEVKKIAVGQIEISQGYLPSTKGITTRIRKSVKSKKTTYYFTLKVNTAGRCIEIENPIDQRDFDDLWQLTINRLIKIRYLVECLEGSPEEVWEIDFLKKDGKTYLSLAECELDEGQNNPVHIPSIVQENLIFEVPLEDTRFSNKLLSDFKYAETLIKSL